jgi:EH domain-containing protein 1
MMSSDGESRTKKNATGATTPSAEVNTIKNTSSTLGQYKVDANVVRDLKSLYKDKLLDIERASKFNKFHHPEILDAELAAKPSVLLIGQYSTGKTTFIKHLIGMDYPEIHIGPEPTTDRFIAVVYGDERKTIKGNALTGVNDLPFSGLSTFGSAFLNKFSAAVVPAPLLNHMNIIDTPGVLSGEKQRTARGYDFPQVSRWFAERSDLILLMFDCSKLDISDEFKSVIEELQPHEDKVHCVLNKADQLDTESLMRVYGALLWSMGRIFKGAEVSRIYVGSFREETLTREEHAALFHKDEVELKSHLAELPKACSMRKVNEIVKRVRLCVVHLCVLGHLRSRMPYFWGANGMQTVLINNLDEVYEEVRRTYQLSDGDFPRIDEFRAKLQLEDFYSFPKTDRKTLQMLQMILTEDIPYIVSQLAGVSDMEFLSDSEDGESLGERGDSKSEGVTSPAASARRGSKHGKGGDGSSMDSSGESNKQPKIFTLTESENDYQVWYYFTGAFFVAFAVVLGVLYFSQIRDDPMGLLQELLRFILIRFIELAEKLMAMAQNSLTATYSAVGGSADGMVVTSTPTVGAAGAVGAGAAAAASSQGAAGLAAAATAGVKTMVDSLAGGVASTMDSSSSSGGGGDASAAPAAAQTEMKMDDAPPENKKKTATVNKAKSPPVEAAAAAAPEQTLEL